MLVAELAECEVPCFAGFGVLMDELVAVAVIDADGHVPFAHVVFEIIIIAGICGQYGDNIATHECHVTVQPNIERSTLLVDFVMVVRIILQECLGIRVDLMLVGPDEIAALPVGHGDGHVPVLLAPSRRVILVT